jgi:RNA polymerase sigma factor (sigma-70 family)
MEDWQLLDRWRSFGANAPEAQDAFGELVSRHIGLVHGACRRRLRDAHLAEDAAQSVFLLLAHRPPRRGDGRAVAGWLVQTADYVCRNIARTNARRAKNERAAYEFRTQSLDAAFGPSKSIDADLDAALADLGAADRDLLLLRYYQGRNLLELSDALGVSQNTAAKRLSRAVSRMRRCLASRGVHFADASAIAPMLAAMGHGPVSRALLAKITPRRRIDRIDGQRAGRDFVHRRQTTGMGSQAHDCNSQGKARERGTGRIDRRVRRRRGDHARQAARGTAGVGCPGAGDIAVGSEAICRGRSGHKTCNASRIAHHAQGRAARLRPGRSRG